MNEQTTDAIDYRECTICGPPGHVGLTFVAREKGFDPDVCDRCKGATCLPKPAPKEVVDDLRARGFIETPGYPSWFKRHTSIVGELNAVGFAWILTKPQSVQRLIVRFPPACVVRVRSTGQYGVCIGVIAGDTDFPTLRVAPSPGVKHGTEYTPDDCEVVGFWNGMDHAAVESILEVARPVAVLPKKDGPKRNDPCPCGSGKKFKHCHLRLGPSQPGALQ